MKTIGNPPEWATELFTTVCKDYNRGLPSQFVWKNANRSGSSGVHKPGWGKRYRMTKGGKLKATNWWGEIIVRAGSDIQDQKLVLLHELAHHVAARSKTRRHHGHTIRFWKLAFEFYDRYGVDMEYAYDREKNYKAKATQAYEYHIAAKGEAA